MRRLPEGIEKLPSGRYRASLSGAAGRRSGGKKTFDRLADAVRWRRENSGKPNPGSMTLGEWLNRWMSYRKHRVAPVTYYNDGIMIKRHLSTIKDIRLSELNSLIIEDWVESIRRKGFRVIHQRCHRFLRSALNAAVKRNLLSVNPMAGIDPPSSLAGGLVKVSLTADELRRLIEVADGWGDACPFLGVLIRVAFDCACRPGEVFALRWQDYDADRSVIHIRKSICPTTHTLKEPKTKASIRSIVISLPTRESLDWWRQSTRYPKASDPIFPSPTGKHFRFTRFRLQIWRPLLRSAGIPDRPEYSLYILRHTAATLSLRHGQNLVRVANRLGHTNVKITASVYSHLAMEDQIDFAKTTGEILTAAAENVGGDAPRMHHDGGSGSNNERQPVNAQEVATMESTSTHDGRS